MKMQPYLERALARREGFGRRAGGHGKRCPYETFSGGQGQWAEGRHVGLPLDMSNRYLPGGLCGLGGELKGIGRRGLWRISAFGR